MGGLPGDLDLFIIPSNTDAIRAISKLTGVFALYFSLQLTLVFILVSSTTWDSQEHANVVINYIMTPLVAFSLFFFIYPQIILVKIIHDHQRKILFAIEEKVALLWRKWMDGPDYDSNGTIEKLTHLHTQIINTATSPLDINTITRFITSIALPISALGSDSIVIKTLSKYIKLTF